MTSTVNAAAETQNAEFGDSLHLPVFLSLLWPANPVVKSPWGQTVWTHAAVLSLSQERMAVS